MKTSTKIGIIMLLAALVTLGMAGEIRAIDIYDDNGELIDNPTISDFCIEIAHRRFDDITKMIESRVCFANDASIVRMVACGGIGSERACSEQYNISEIVVSPLPYPERQED